MPDIHHDVNAGDDLHDANEIRVRLDNDLEFLHASEVERCDSCELLSCGTELAILTAVAAQRVSRKSS